MAQRVPLAGSVAGRVILTEQPVYLADVGDRSGAVSSGVRSYFGMPLVADGGAIGLLQVDSPVVDAWSEEERSMFLAVAPIVAAAIQNARAHARAGLAELRARALERRLDEAAGIIASLRAVTGPSPEAEAMLSRLDDLVRARGNDDALGDVPRQRRTRPAVTTLAATPSRPLNVDPDIASVGCPVPRSMFSVGGCRGWWATA